MLGSFPPELVVVLQQPVYSGRRSRRCHVINLQANSSAALQRGCTAGLQAGCSAGVHVRIEKSVGNQIHPKARREQGPSGQCHLLYNGDMMI